MVSNILLENAKEILKSANKIGVKLLFIGGIAVSVWGVPRATYDIDCIIMAEEEKIVTLLQQLEKSGFRFDKDTIKFISGNPFITLEKDNLFIDMFISSNEFQKKMFENIKKIKINKTIFPVARAEDLILLKLLSSRQKDMEDIETMFKNLKDGIDLRYLKRWSVKLGIHNELNDMLESLQYEI